MNAIDRALYAKLSSNAALGALLSGTAAVYSPMAPEGASPPYVVFQKQSNVPGYTNGGLAFENCLYMVKGVVGPGTVSANALGGSIAAKIDAALTDQALSISGYKQMLTRRESDIDYSEVVAGKVFLHRGGSYRIQADPA